MQGGKTTEIFRLRVTGNRLGAPRIPICARDGCFMFDDDGLDAPVVAFARATGATVRNKVLVLTTPTKGL